MRLSIMQPYFLPYLGYFQLIHASDLFLVYDNIKYTKKSWINRNRFMRNASDVVFSLPLRSASDYASIVERELAPNFDRKKLIRQFEGAYAKAPQFKSAMPLVTEVVAFPDDNLFRYILHSLQMVCQYLDIDTPFRISSEATVSQDERGSEKVQALCRHFGADTYLNLPGGRELYHKDDFRNQGLKLQFIEMVDVAYPQAAGEFVPKLSVIDVLMNVDKGEIRERLLPAYVID